MVAVASRVTSRKPRGSVPPARLILLLRRVEQCGSVREAAAALGMHPANAHRLLRFTERRLGHAIVNGTSGGRGGGGSSLAPKGRRIARLDPGPPPLTPTRWPCFLLGAPRATEPVSVKVPGAGVHALVAVLPRLPGSSPREATGTLELEIPPSAVTLLPPTFEGIKTSARNQWLGRISRVGAPAPGGIRLVEVRIGSAKLVAALTTPAVEELGLRGNSEVLVQVKATAIRLRRATGR